MKNKELVERTKDAVKRERAVTAEVISYLQEIDKRKVYAELGHSSMFYFCTRELGYSEPAAGRRVGAMKIANDVPEVKLALESGILTLTAVSAVQSFVKDQKIKDPETKRQILRAVQGKSIDDVKRYFAKLAPQKIPQEKIRILTEDETEIRIVLNQRAMQKLKRIKDLWSHKNTKYTYSELFETMADQILGFAEQGTKSQKLAKANSAAEVTKQVSKSKVEMKAMGCPDAKPRAIEKTISAATKHAVWKRDNGKCQWPNCGSTFLVQIDHKEPKIFGGSNDLKNLRLLCATHNRFRAPFQKDRRNLPT